MIKRHKYSLEFNMGEAPNCEKCINCHFNTSSDEVIVCLARNCDTQPTVVEETTVTISNEPPLPGPPLIRLTAQELVMKIIAYANPNETTDEFCARMHYQLV